MTVPRAGESRAGGGEAPLRPRGRRYSIVLALLVVGLVVQSFTSDGVAHRRFLDVLETILALAIYVSVFRGPLQRSAMGILLAVSLAAGWLRSSGASTGSGLDLAYQASTALFYWTAVAVILANLFPVRANVAENIRGAACGYLIAGAAWSSLNGLAHLLVPAAYSVDPHVLALLDDWHARHAILTYYSYAQMLTIGYADITPVRAPATTLSLFAALFGVFYTAVVVAQFVGMANATTPGGNRDGPMPP